MKWEPIAGFSNYEISEDGNVRNIHTGHILKHNIKKGNAPYHRVHLSEKGRATYKLVHRLVLETFVGPCPEGMQTLHHDDDPNNNCLSNLSWGTPIDNHKTIDRKGENNGKCRLTPDDVRAIRQSDEPYRVIAARFNITTGYVSTIKINRTWKHLV